MFIVRKLKMMQAPEERHRFGYLDAAPLELASSLAVTINIRLLRSQRAATLRIGTAVGNSGVGRNLPFKPFPPDGGTTCPKRRWS